MLAEERAIMRYIHEEYIHLQDLMVHEMRLRLEIAGHASRELYCSPAELKELVLGHLYTQRFIRSMEDVLSLEIDAAKGIAAVQLKTTEAKADAAEPPMNDLAFDPVILLRNQQQFYDESTLQKATAGTHRSALCSDAGTHMACIDVSRHNTIDKLVGKALLEGVSLRDKYIITSGRIPSDMLQKIIAIGIPMIVSRSAPTTAAMDMAKEANITLVGFSRENRFNIYSVPGRLKGCGAVFLKENTASR